MTVNTFVDVLFTSTNDKGLRPFCSFEISCPLRILDFRAYEWVAGFLSTAPLPDYMMPGIMHRRLQLPERLSEFTVKLVSDTEIYT